ncbi:primosomal protein N' [Streptosporangium sp. KLBMP 9127]|nr:primosomal protein N' [Streptosporangium sp. KLBMP 9127]
MSPAGQAKAKGVAEPAEVAPVARVAVDNPLPHLDRPFDYLVPMALDAAAVPGCRVRVRFAGKLVHGFLLERVETSEHTGRLTALERVVSPEPVLTPEISGLARAVADRYAGTLADVLRLAVPPRHARVEQEKPETPPGDLAGQAEPETPGAAGDAVTGPREPVAAIDREGRWDAYPMGRSFLGALTEGRGPRAVWTALPGVRGARPEWAEAVAAAVAATLAGARGAVVVMPDGKDVALVDAALGAALGAGRHVALTADLGPAERYRRWLRLLRGQVAAVVGTRAAMFAPVRDLGLVVIWDDGDDLHAEPLAPYPHAREVLALRAHRTGAGMLLGGHARTAEATQLVAQGWARPIVASRETIRARAPRVRPAGDDAELARDSAARAARLPSLAWRVLRQGLESGPVLVQVPRRGYLPVLACQGCRAPARCVQATARPVGERGSGLFDQEPSGLRFAGSGVVGFGATVPAGTGPLNGGVAGLGTGGDDGPAGSAGLPEEPRLAGRRCGGPLALRGGHNAPYCRWCGRIAGEWRCPSCGSGRVRAQVVGARRTAEELGRAFPSVPVRTSGRDGVLASVGAGRALVVATPGAEPVAEGGYAAAVLLDGWALLGRPDLRAAEEALRRWMNAAALLRPAAELVVLADSGVPAVQGLVRWDPVTHAERELSERLELAFPPAVRLATLTGSPGAVREMLAEARLPGSAQVLGPVPVEAPRRESPQERALVRVPRGSGTALAAALKGASGVRSARKAAEVVRVCVDPVEGI